MAVVCGRTCALSVGGSTIANAYKWEYKSDANVEDVTHFGSGIEGSWIVCTKKATVTMESYDAFSASINDTVTVTLSGGISSTVYGIVISKGESVDAKGVVTYTLTVQQTTS